jgi:hypothetical protein
MAPIKLHFLEVLMTGGKFIFGVCHSALSAAILGLVSLFTPMASFSIMVA